MAGSPEWTRSDAVRSPAPSSPPPSCFRPACPASSPRCSTNSKKLTPSSDWRLPGTAPSGRAEIAIGAASVAEIERLNILHAAMLAMCRAVARLPAPPDLALVDGNQPPALPCPVHCVVGGDGISLSIAAASIVAKVVRDRLMDAAGRALSRLWLAHQRRLRHARAPRRRCERLGPTPHHRAGFGTGRQAADLDLVIDANRRC